jgi:alternate signal-mediated exported protein
MNNTLKGALAGTAGIALLMGGFGSYALWSDSEALAPSTVQSGELSIDTAPGSYDDARTAQVGDWSADAKMVPGDVITYTQSFTVTGSGKNLKGTIALTPAAMSPNSFSGNLTRTVEVTDTSSNSVITSTGPRSFSFDAPFGTATLKAVVTYTFNASGVEDQNRAATTPSSTFTISQG